MVNSNLQLLKIEIVKYKKAMQGYATTPVIKSEMFINKISLFVIVVSCFVLRKA